MTIDIGSKPFFCILFSQLFPKIMQFCAKNVKEKQQKIHFHSPVNEINDTAKGDDNILMWTEVECGTVW
jgi:hypothetical protein